MDAIISKINFQELIKDIKSSYPGSRSLDFENLSDEKKAEALKLAITFIMYGPRGSRINLTLNYVNDGKQFTINDYFNCSSKGFEEFCGTVLAILKSHKSFYDEVKMNSVFASRRGDLYPAVKPENAKKS